MCSPAPCKVLNGGSQDEVITVWAVAGHHYDLITHNITTKYNYQTFIIQNWPELCTSQHYVSCHYRTAVLGLVCTVRTCSCEEARGPPITITRALGWLLVTRPSAVCLYCLDPPSLLRFPLVRLLQPAVLASKYKRGISDNFVSSWETAEKPAV